ncbi:hypothetical protein [Plebeiibacterium sediminum]|uniref:ATP-grasp domain-containing protein n=1 Tax=Plebeiibacterium sediminum TaxID=2992112 RepID=A0AAE3SET3_9BACT|nr:hypothetical protein [Plebeiobacterium sediminum]MCW3785463.1 hypothetical protein [Plebeiobacterium sediminum]
MNNIYIYNPTSEMALANGTVSYMPPKNLQTFEKDLAFVPSFFAEDDDIIIMDAKPDPDFIKMWQDMGLPKLKYLNFSEIKDVITFNHLRPWSWNQTVHHKFKTILPNCSDDFKLSPNYTWNNEHKFFFSRNSANRVQKYISEKVVNHHAVNIPCPAININSVEEMQEWLKNYSKAIIKMPWSSSGRGIHIIDDESGKNINYDWIKGAIKQQGFVTAEPLLNKIFDFSFQLNIKRNGAIECLGYSYFLNDSKGHFIGGNINWPHKEDDISEFLNSSTLQEATQLLITGLKTIEPHKFHEGPIGVDAIVFMDNNNTYKIHPCLDINWRYNMGLINIRLPRFVHKEAKGKWLVGSFKPGEWNQFIQKSKEANPLALVNNKIKSGFINMTPPNENARFGVWMEIFK